MDTTTQALIADLISHRIVDSWVFWILFFIVSGLSALAANFLKAYASRRGEQLATKADFNNLKEQLQATTRLTEEIKSEVGHIEWRMRETYTARRAKLEEFVQQIGTVSSTIDSWVSRALAGGEFEALDYECMNRLEMLARLYFPTLFAPTMAFILAWRQASQHAIASMQALSQINQADVQAYRRQMQEGARGYQPLYEETLTTRSALQMAVVTSMADVLEFPDELRRDQRNEV